MATGLNGTLTFNFVTLDTSVVSKAKVNWSETYDITQNSSVLSIDSIEMSSPIWNNSYSRLSGDLLVDGVAVLKFRIASFGRVMIPEEGYAVVKETASEGAKNASASITIEHNHDGTRAVDIEFVPTEADGYTHFTVTNGPTWETAFYMDLTPSSNNPQTINLSVIPRSVEPEAPTYDPVIDDSRYSVTEGLEVMVLDSDFVPIQLIEKYESLIWTVRYRDLGDFELITYMDEKLYYYLQTERLYFKLEESDRLMVPESWEITTDIENGDRLKVKGRSLESVLDRRIVWGQRTFSDPTSIQDVVRALLTENAISPSDSNRKLWNGLIYVLSSDPSITDTQITAQFFGESLLEIIKSICESFSLGFELIQNGARNTIEFSLYSGIDRSAEQMYLPVVTFSPEYDNLLTSGYVYDESGYRNVALVAGQEEKSSDDEVDGTTLVLGGNGSGIQPTVSVGEGSMLNRYEMFVDASGLGRTVEDEDGESSRDLTEEEYESLMEQEGSAKLSENAIYENVEATVDPNRTFAFGKDYFLGDILTVENQYGIRAQTRVIEVIYSEDSSGKTICPTFEIV